MNVFYNKDVAENLNETKKIIDLAEKSLKNPNILQELSVYELENILAYYKYKNRKNEEYIKYLKKS